MSMGGHRSSSAVKLVASLLPLIACWSRAARTPNWEGAGPFDLKAYVRCSQLDLPTVGNQASGLTYSPLTNTWWLLRGDPGPALYELSSWPNITILRALRIPARDPEAVTWLGGTTLVVADEHDNSLQFMDVGTVPGRNDVARLLSVVQPAPPILMRPNEGIEGMAPVWPLTTPSDVFNTTIVPSQMVLAQQDNPRRLITLDMVTGTWQVLFDLDANAANTNRATRSEAAKKLGSFSDLYLTPDNRMFVISRRDQTIGELSVNGTLLQSLHVELPFPEGLAFTPNGELMMVASEGKGASAPSYLAVYRLANCTT